MNSPDFAQNAGGGANISITKNPDGSFTGTLPIPGFPPVTGATEKEVMEKLSMLMQEMMGKAGMGAAGGPATPPVPPGPPAGPSPAPMPPGM